MFRAYIHWSPPSIDDDLWYVVPEISNWDTVIFEEIITSSNDVFKDFGSDMAVRIRIQGNPTQETAKGSIILI